MSTAAKSWKPTKADADTGKTGRRVANVALLVLLRAILPCASLVAIWFGLRETGDALGWGPGPAWIVVGSLVWFDLSYGSPRS